MDLKERRTKLGLTQEELSRLSGFSIQTISRLENGKGHEQNVSYRYISKTLDYLESLTDEELKLYKPHGPFDGQTYVEMEF